MNDLPRQKLCEIISTYGRSVSEDERRCEGLLRDFCGEYKREISVLVNALKERVATDLLVSSDAVPRKVLLARLMKRLLDNRALAEDAARWAVASWALALGVISNAECEVFELEITAATQKKGGRTSSTAKKQRSATEKIAKKRDKSDQVHPFDQTTPPPPFPPQETPPSQTLIVSQGGQSQYGTIREAIADARPGTRILIRPGLYKEGLILDKPVEIVGDGPREDIIVESIDSDCLLMQTDRAAVQGLTLRGRANAVHKTFYAVDIPQGQLVLENCDITSDSLACVAVHNAMATPLIRRCQIHDGAESGLFFYENGRGTVEDCDIFGNAEAGIEICEGAQPIIRRSKIHDGKQNGIFVHQNGQGMVEDCDIFGNAEAGVKIGRSGDLTVRKCRLNRNGTVAVAVDKNAVGRVEDCDLADNVHGTWDLEVGSQVQRSGNTGEGNHDEEQRAAGSQPSAEPRLWTQEEIMAGLQAHAEGLRQAIRTITEPRQDVDPISQQGQSASQAAPPQSIERQAVVQQKKKISNRKSRFHQRLQFSISVLITLSVLAVWSLIFKELPTEDTSFLVKDKHLDQLGNADRMKDLAEAEHLPRKITEQATLPPQPSLTRSEKSKLPASSEKSKGNSLAKPRSEPVLGAYRILRNTKLFREPREDADSIFELQEGVRINVVGVVKEKWLRIESKRTDRPPGYVRREDTVPLLKESESSR